MIKKMNRILCLTLCFLLVACSGAKSDSAGTVEAYVRSLVEKSAERLAALSCADWEASAQTELDSFQAVEADLEGLDCIETSRQEDTAVVTCQGKILATYNEEVSEFDLSLRPYRVVLEGSEWLVCGYE